MPLRVFCLAIPRTTGDLAPEPNLIQAVHPMASGSIESEDLDGELQPFCVVDVEFKDGTWGTGMTWPHREASRRAIEILPAADLTKAWVHGAVSSQPDEKAFWTDVVSDLLDQVHELVPFPHIPDEDLAREFWNTLQHRLGICLDSAEAHNHPTERSH